MSRPRVGLAVAATAVVVAVAAWRSSAALDRRDGLAPAWDAAPPRSTATSEQAAADSARIAGLLTMLASGDALVCELVADQVGNGWHMGDARAPGRFGDTRSAAIAARDSLHARISHAGTIDLLMQTLGSPDPCVRRIAAKWLGRSTVAPTRLAALLEAPSATVREAAAFALGVGAARESRGALEAMLTRRSGAEAAMAAWALAEAEDVASAPVLERALRSDDARVRRVAAYALGELGALRSAEPLADALRDRDPEVRHAAASALGEIDELEVLPQALLDACRADDPILVRIAARIVAERHAPATLDLLLHLATLDDAEVRVAVAAALGEIRSTKANPTLVRLLNDPDAEVRRAAAEALGEIRDGAHEP